MSSASRGKSSWESTLSLPPPTGKKTRSSRQANAKKLHVPGGEGAESFDGMDYATMCRVDRLVGSFDLLADLAGGGAEGEDDDDDFDELTEVEKKRKKRAAPMKRKNAVKKVVLEKRFKPCPLSVALSDDSSRLTSSSGGPPSSVYHALSLPPRSSRPPRHVCPVTNLPALYKDPSSKIRYSSLAALTTVRESWPSWVKNLGGGGVEYYEAVGGVRERVGRKVGGVVGGRGG